MRFYQLSHLLMFLFGDFIHHKDCLTYSDGSDRPGELCYNFSTSKDLVQLVNFPTQIPTVTLTVVPFFYLFIYSYVRICFTTAFTSLWNSDHVVVTVCSDFPWNSLRDAMVHRIVYHISPNKHLTSNKCHPLISASPLGIHIEISTSPLISGTPLNVALIRIVTIFY